MRFAHPKRAPSAEALVRHLRRHLLPNGATSRSRSIDVQEGVEFRGDRVYAVRRNFSDLGTGERANGTI